MENTFDHYRSTLKTMLKNRLERCSSRERSTFSNGKYFKGRGGKSKKRIEQRNRARFPTLRAEERERGRATLEKIKGTREREREKALGPEHYSRTRIWITRGWSETCQEARKRRRRWWWGRGFQSFFQAWRSSSMMRTEGFAVGSSWKERGEKGIVEETMRRPPSRRQF